MWGRWTALGMRTRITVVTAVALAVTLAATSVGFLVLFAGHRYHALDRIARTRATRIAELVASGQLPQPLPVPPTEATLVQVIDGQGRVVAASPTASRTLPLLTARELRGTGTAVRRVADPVSGDRLRVVVRRTTSPSGPLVVVAASSTSTVTAAVAALRYTLLIVLPVATVLGGWASWLLVGAALRPVEALRAAADSVTDPAGAELPEPRSEDEIARLARTLNGMLRRLAQIDERQRAFVADAAHELRSPVAAMRTQLDVALAHPGDQPWEMTADTVVAELDRMSRLVDDLLLLARLDSGHVVDRVVVDLGDLARDIATEQRRRVPVAVSVTGDCLVTGERPTLRRALLNLVDNATRHAESRVDVTVSAGPDGVDVNVTDDGTGVAAADADRIFERFTRLDEARGRDAGGTGLGLSIARSIARAHGGDLTVRTGTAGGATFVVRLPPTSTAPP